MATLIPALGACLRRMTPGEKRLAERLEDKLDDDYLLWYDVPVGPKQTHPDFVVLHARRCLLVADTKNDDGITLLKPVSYGGEYPAPSSSNPPRATKPLPFRPLGRAHNGVRT